jgi:hypothetical protein
MRGIVWAAYFFAAGYVVAKLEPDIGTVVRESYDRLIDYTVTRALAPQPGTTGNPGTAAGVTLTMTQSSR